MAKIGYKYLQDDESALAAKVAGAFFDRPPRSFEFGNSSFRRARRAHSAASAGGPSSSMQILQSHLRARDETQKIAYLIDDTRALVQPS